MKKLMMMLFVFISVGCSSEENYIVDCQVVHYEDGQRVANAQQETHLVFTVEDAEGITSLTTVDNDYEMNFKVAGDVDVESGFSAEFTEIRSDGPTYSYVYKETIQLSKRVAESINKSRSYTHDVIFERKIDDWLITKRGVCNTRILEKD